MKKAAKKTITFPVSVWYNPDTGHIHLARPSDPGFITTISPDTGSKRSHPHLYRQLSKALRDSGAISPTDLHS